MSIASQITRLTTVRNTIRTKFVQLGIAKEIDDFSALATAAESIENRGAVSATVQEGDTYTIPKGYHNGSGTVSGVSGGGNYNLQSKEVAPTKMQQNITPDSGYYGLSDVTISPIPDNYQDVSATTATASDVLSGKAFIGADGAAVIGNMTNNGAIEATIDGLTVTSYTVPAGYTTGGTVSLTSDIEDALAAL